MVMDPRNIFWPMRAKAEPNGVQRLGRVSHWTFVGLGGLFCILAVGGDIGLLGVALGLVLSGRALRYVMAGE